MVNTRQTGPLKQVRPIQTPRQTEAKPTEQQIRERAHQIYESRQGAHGCPEMDWLEAERSLNEPEQNSPSASSPGR
jgi:hypothetical protein